MAPKRLTRDPEDVQAAWDAAVSMTDFCKRLRFCYNPPTASRLCEANGLEYPAPHWGGFRLQPEQPPVAARDITDDQLASLCEERGIVVMKKAVTEDREHEIPVPTFDGQGSFRIGIVSDTHAGSKYAQTTFLRAAYEEFARQGIGHVLHAGDLTGGAERMHPGITYELHAHGADEQVEVACETLPHVDGITTHVITGNHDHSHMKSGGTNVGKRIADQRPDVDYLGMSGAYVTMNGIRFYVHHPSGGAAYARSYRLQKQIEQFSPENKPKVLLMGHFHVTCLLPMYRNVYALMLPCFEAQTPYLVEKGLYPEIAFTILDVTYDDDGAVKFRHEFMPLYRPRANDHGSAA